MAVDINGTTINVGGSALSVKTSTANTIFDVTSTGILSSSSRMPLFNVGWTSSSGGWTSFGSSGTWYTVPFSYTSGEGYFNYGNLYDTTTYRFTAPWTGLYLFKQHIYIYYPDSAYSWYTHPQFTVNGGLGTRRPGDMTPYRIRQYGLYGSYGHDTDCCELISLVAGDYVSVSCYVGNGMQGYAPYSAFSGTYMGN